MTANVMREREDFPKLRTFVRLVRYTEGNALNGDQSAPDIDVRGRVIETPHPSFLSNYLVIRPAIGERFRVQDQASGERYTIGPTSITIHANEGWRWTWEPAADPDAQVNLPAVIDAMGDTDPRLVRAEIALRLIRHAADNVRPTHPGAATLLDEAKAVLGPVTNGITGPGVTYAAEYIERLLDKLAETPKGKQ